MLPHARARDGPGRVQDLVAGIFDEDLHAKRVASLGNAVVGVLEGAALGVAAIGSPGSGGHWRWRRAWTRVTR